MQTNWDRRKTNLKCMLNNESGDQSVLIWHPVEASVLSSLPSLFMLLELELGAVHFSKMHLRILIDSSVWAHHLESALYWFWREVTLWRKTLIFASCFSSKIWTSVCSFASRIFLWALIFSSSAWRTAQWRKYSLHAMLEEIAEQREGVESIEGREVQRLQRCSFSRELRRAVIAKVEG